MASLFRHLWVLLWKNWLSVKRQPLWSFTLISLPVFSFILMAVIRIQFPPEAQSNCYLAPRNLPSTGFLPFLQTVLCSSDSTCKSAPYTPEDLLPKLNISLKSRRQRRSTNQAEESSPSSQSADVLQNRNSLLRKLFNSLSLKQEQIPDSTSSSTNYDRIYLLNKILTLAEKQDSSQANLKVAICEVLSVNASLQSLLSETLGMNIYQPFCLNSMSLLESFFQELRTHISKLQKYPSYQMAFVQEAGSFLSLISQVQNETSIWNLFLMTPDILHGAITVRDMIDTFHSSKRLFMKRDNSSKMILNMTSWLSTLNCSEQDKNNLTANYIWEQPISSKKILILFAKMKEVLRNLLALDFDDEDFKTDYFLKDFKRNTSSQNSLKKMPLFDLKETQNIYSLNRSIRDITFLNSIFKARKAWQSVIMTTALRLPFLPEKYRKYLTSVEEVHSLLINFLLKPATTDNFPEKLLALQKIFTIITNSRTNHNYLLISSLTNLMQTIQNSINESQWNEFNTYWHIVEKLRSEKWSDTDILMYKQILDILHDNLYVNHNNFGLPLKIELEQMIKFVNHLLKKYDAGIIKKANASMVLNTILKSLQVLEDLEKKYISELFIVNPQMNTNNDFVQKLFQIIKGIELLSDPSQIEAFNINKTDTLLSFSQALLLLDLYMTPLWHNSSIQAKTLQLLHLAPSLLQMGNIQADNRFSDCTVKDFHLIAIEVFFNNATLKEALRERKCNLPFSSLDFENQTTYDYMFTQLLQFTTKNLKSASLFEIIRGNKKKHFSDEFKCLIKLLEVSSSFLSKLFGIYKYQNSWIEKINKNLSAFSLNLSQHNLTCREPLFRNITDKISALHIQSPFIFKGTVADIQNILANPSFWNQTFVLSFLLHNKHQKIVAKVLQMSKNVVHQSKWNNFSEILSKTAEILHSKQNVTNTKQYIQFLETLRWGARATSLEDILDVLKLFLNSSSDIDYKIYFRKNMNTFLSSFHTLFLRLFYINPSPEQIKHILNKITRISNDFFLNKNNLKLTMMWKTIQKMMSVTTTQFPMEISWAFDSREEIPLTSSDSILKPFLTPQNKYHSKTNEILITYLSQLLQRIQNTAKKSWSNELKAFVNIHRELRPVMGSSLFLSTLYKHLSLLNNASDLHFNSELQGLTQLLSYALPKYIEKTPPINISEQIHIVVRKLLFHQRFRHQFISQLETILPLANNSHKIFENIYDVLNQGAMIPLLFSDNETDYIQNFIDKLIDRSDLATFFKQLQDYEYLNFPVNEATQRNEDDISIPSKSNFSEIWKMLSKWYLMKTKNARYGLKMTGKVPDNNKSVPEMLNISISILNHLDLLKELKANPDPNLLSKRTELQYKFDRIRHPFLMIAETLLNKTFWKEWEQAKLPSNVIAQFLFQEFENVFLKTSHNSNISSYFICIMNMFQGPNDELSGNCTIPPKIRKLKGVLFNSQNPFATVPEILMLKLTHLQNLTSLLCDFESIRWLQQTCQLPDISFAELCSQSEFHKKLLRSRNQSDHAVTNLISHRTLSQQFQEIIVGNPQKLLQQIKWLQENVPQLKYFHDNSKYISSWTSIMNISKTTPHSRKQDMIIDLFRNADGLKNDLRNIVGLSTQSISAFTEMPLSENKTQLIFQILQLESCDTETGDAKLEIIAKQFCNFSLAERAYKSYLLGVTFLRYLDVYKFIYKMLFPKEFQIPVDKALELLKNMNHLRMQLVSDVHPLLDAIHSLKKLRMTRHAPLSKALFEASNLTINSRMLKTISKTFCNHEITPLFFESLLPDFEEQNVHHSSADEDVQHIMKKYSIPSDTTPFCVSLFLDLVKTPSGALIWSFLKPMLRGRILYSPDTPETRAIMEKSNSTLKLMADLTHKAQEWLDRSPLLMDSLVILNDTLPMLKNTLQNPFVQVFIKLMVKLDAVELLNQINELDDIRLELQNSTDIINQLIILARLSINASSCVLLDRIQSGKTVEEMEMMAKDLFLRNELLASVIFKLPSSGTKKYVTPSGLFLPPLVNYTIRMSSKLSQTTKRIREKIWTVGPHNSASQSQIYSRAFVYIQDSIDRAIIELQTGKSAEEIAVQVQGTPYPCYNKDMFLTSVTYSLPFTLMAAWTLFIAAFVKKLVQEKDLRLYEYMKMMGVNSSSHFFAWFIECITFLLITNIFLIFILKFGNILPKINVIILFLYVLDYSLSIIAMCYLISVFFNNTNIAALVGCLVYILAFFPFIVLLVVENQMSFTIKSLLSLLSPTAFSYASQYIARYEEQGIGLQWDNMHDSPMSGDNTNFSWMCWLILIDSFIYFILGWYIRNVFPGKYGMAAPWYFPLLPSYWTERYGYFPLLSEKLTSYLFTNFFSRKQSTFPEKIYVHNALPSNIEPEPTHLKVGVSLQGITKIYESKAAVQNLNLNFYEGNVTSLLGHNGAGKTTTISILTGLFPASSGTIFVYGKDIRTDQDFIRKNMGICMQHNVLFDYLTTKEHLLLYGYIKVPHWSKEELQEEIDRLLKETGLYNHRHKLTGSLSGGMKRKLSISIALLGGSKVVILDEPTTGVDPCSRRGIWEIISKNRKGRTIILSTHHLDEAEVLSDRIAFLEHGGLKCCGSPFYLKETYGSGYHLTLTKEKSSVLNVAEECNTSNVTAAIQAHLPEAYLKEDIGGELIYVLPPFNNKVSSSYQSLLRHLDSNLSDLHIGCYGISDSTVEEVFLNLTKDFAKDEQTDAQLSQEGPSFTVNKDGLSMNSNNVFEPDDQVLINMGKPSNLSLLLKKSTALFIKRFHHTRRDVKGFIAQVILPVLFVTAAMGLGTLRTKVAEYPALHLSPALYGSSSQSDFFGNYNQTTDVLVASMFSFPGIDNICLNRSNLTCFKEDVAEKWIFIGNQSDHYTTCNCTLSGETCPKMNFSPPHKRTFSSRTIYNLTGHDVETYLLVTAQDFIQKRYGGWSFGLPLTSNLQFDVSPVPANRTITKVWYNPEGYHSLPAYLNSLNNFILHAYLPHGNTSGYGISVIAHPYPGGESQEQAMLSSLLDIIVSMSVLIGYSITTASFVLYVVKEHQTKAKQLQHISGLDVTSYWMTNFIYDMVYFLVPVILSVGVISAFQIPAFFNDNNLMAVFLLLFLFGYSTFSWMYLLAGIFKETGMAFIVYVCINLFFGVNTIITHSVVFLLSQEKATDKDLHDLAETLRHIFLIFPQFCFGYGLIELSQYHALMGFLKAYGVVYPDKTFELDRTTSKLLGMFIQGTLFFAVRLLLDDGRIQKIWHKILQFLFNQLHGKSPLYLEDVEEEDKDVRAERERVTLGLSDSDVLQLQNLSKIYHLPYRRIVAVRNVNIGIPAGECFGLLGVNGAGKTTIFKMLTGDIGPTDGRLLMQDETGSLSEIDGAHRSQFGYCPQEDALDDLLTIEEHMYYYARLHGIPEEDIKGIVFHLLYRLNLMPYRCRIASMCSYGTNRKLSAALALLGKPSVLLLDEPSSGMDPNAKRHLWKIITEEVQNQCSVILTSHSMEECEALCTRLAIMVNGHFQCLGSLQHIKSRFGKGFTVKMHLNNSADSIEKLTLFLQTNFPNTHLRDHQLNMVEYHIPVSAGGVANIFQLVEMNKEIFEIKHFSVSQTTLEEVFINFAKTQTSPEISDAITYTTSEA
ncbi:glucosylceramide transporter ABCA12 [Erythrolamprus reginae]|uniref:glucosylceramide transporter ABCA12 n=1 Tax=Erythrolamprus reginae TaxID=121349 RepID=UPI00396CB700